MTLHHTDFVSSLFAERGRIRAAQGLLSERLVALEQLLALYVAKTPSPATHSPETATTSTAARKDVPESDELAGPVQNQDGGSLAPQNDRAGGTVEVSAGVESVTVGRAEQPVACPRSNGSQAGTQAPPVDTNTETPPPSPGSEAAVDDADAAPAGEVPSPVASPAPTSTRQRVKQLHDEHPEYTRRQAWEALGITEGSLAGHSFALGIKWRPLEPVRFKRPAPPPPSEDAITPDETVTPSSGFSAPRPSRPKGAQFRLRAGRGEGKYLHMSGVGMTDNKTYAWIGTEAQMLKLRQKFPDARDLVEEVVEKEPAR